MVERAFVSVLPARLTDTPYALPLPMLPSTALLNNEIISSRAATEATQPMPATQELGNKSKLILQALDQRIRIWETQFGLNKPGSRLDDSSSSSDDDGDACAPTPQPRSSSSPARRSNDSGSVTLVRESGEGILKVKPPAPARAPGSPNQRPKSARTTTSSQFRMSAGSTSSTDQTSPLRRSDRHHSSPGRVRFASESSTEPTTSNHYQNTHSAQRQDHDSQNALRLSSEQLRQEFARSMIQQVKAGLDEIAQEAIGRMEAVASSITIPPPLPPQTSLSDELSRLVELQSGSSQVLDSLATQVQEMQHSLRTITTALLGVSEQQRTTSAEISQLGPQVRSSATEANIKWQSCLDSIRQLEQMLCGPGGVVLTLQRTNDELLQRVGSLQQELESTKAQHRYVSKKAMAVNLRFKRGRGVLGALPSRQPSNARTTLAWDRLEMELLQQQFDELAATVRRPVRPAAPETSDAPGVAQATPMAGGPSLRTGAGVASPERRKQQPASSSHAPTRVLEAARISQQLQLDLKPL